jgi:SRSO17 transposase
VDSKDNHAVAACGSVDVDQWWQQIQDLWLDWFAGCFRRVEVRRSAWSYVEGLMSLVRRKNCWWLAQQAEHGDPGRLQRLLGAARWDADVLRDALLRLVATVLATPDGVLVVDETGFAKKGTASAAVARQYSGTLGRVDNCQLAVFLGYATTRVRLLVDRALYLPKVWAEDTDRRAKASVPTEVVFATKPNLALAMIRRAMAAGVVAAWVTADEAYGRAGYFRAGLRTLGLGYVVAVARDQRVRIAGQRHRVDMLAAKVAPQGWQRYSCGLGSKGPREYRWAWLSIEATGQGHHSLLIRRGSDGKLAYYLTWHTKPAAFAELITVAGRRWTIEETFQITKDQFGLDQTQVRSWHGWHRHATLTMISFALTALAIRDDQPDTNTPPHDLTHHSGPIAVTVNEARYLIAAIILATKVTGRRLLNHLRHWSTWRRTHQDHARAAHYRRRLATTPC